MPVQEWVMSVFVLSLCLEVVCDSGVEVSKRRARFLARLLPQPAERALETHPYKLS